MHFHTTYCFVILSVSYVSSHQEHQHQTSDDRVSYEGAQVWRTMLNTSKNVLEIKRLIDENEISVWNIKPTHVDYLVAARKKVTVYRRLRSQDLGHAVLIANVQHKIESQKTAPALWTEESLRLGHRLDFNFYPELDVIEEYLNYIRDQYKSICTVETIGHSIENRPIQMVVISNQNPNNEGVMLVSGAHSREWVAVSSILYILNDLVTKFDSLPAHVTNKKWYIIPVQNPDGYEYSHKKDRLWRKNRRPHDGSCYGVDMNRNYGTHWFVEGVTSTNPCTETYAGKSAFSEPETRVVKTVIESNKISAFVDLHSYGQAILYAWGGVSRLTPHDKMLNNIALDMHKAIFKTNERKYIFGTVFHVMYPASGSSVDFAHSSGIHKAFVIESRDTGLHGFLLPPDQIVDTGMELKAAVHSLAAALDSNFRLLNPPGKNVYDFKINFNAKKAPKYIRRRRWFT